MWTQDAKQAMRQIKILMASSSVLELPDFNKTIEVTCDASSISIGRILNQENHSIAYFSEKLNDAKQRYSTNDLEFYEITQTFKY